MNSEENATRTTIGINDEEPEISGGSPKSQNNEKKDNLKKHTEPQKVSLDNSHSNDNVRVSSPGVDGENHNNGSAEVIVKVNIQDENRKIEDPKKEDRAPENETKLDSENETKLDSENETKPDSENKTKPDSENETKPDSENTEVDPSKQNDIDIDEYDPDLHITDDERKAFEFMLEQRRNEIIQQKENFKNWVESITRRRMFALSRLRKINKCHTERMIFYEKIDDYLKTADGVINSTDNSPRNADAKQFEEIVRENTGFVITSDTESRKSVNSTDSSDIEDAKNNTNGKQINIDKNNGESFKTNKPLGNNSIKSEDSTNNNIIDDDPKNSIISNSKNDTPQIVPVQS